MGLQARLKHALEQVPGLSYAVGKVRRIPRRRGRKRLLRALPPGTVGMEIGVHLGDFSQRMLDQVAPRELHLVDLWEHRPEPAYSGARYGARAVGGAAEMEERFARVQARFAGPVAAGVVTIHRGYSDAVLEQFPDGYFDWIYIDGNHFYEYVRRDLELAATKVRAGGLITGDDYGPLGWWEGGVTRAVDEFVAARPSTELRIFGDQYLIHNA